MDAFVIGDKIMTIDSLKCQPKRQRWMRACDHTGLRIQTFDDNALKKLNVNPSIYRQTSRMQNVEDNWAVVYMIALYKGEAIEGNGSVISLWYSVNNNQLFSIRSTYLRLKASTWFDYLRDRSGVHLDNILQMFNHPHLFLGHAVIKRWEGAIRVLQQLMK
jgi:hypothetical protein